MQMKLVFIYNHMEIWTVQLCEDQTVTQQLVEAPLSSALMVCCGSLSFVSSRFATFIHALLSEL